MHYVASRWGQSRVFSHWNDVLAFLAQIGHESGGFRYLRFHAIFHDVLKTVTRDAGGSLRFDFSGIDRLYDALLARRIKPFIELGFKLGFGGAVTYERALKLRRLAAELPLSALVLETDAPDIPPHWLYVTAGQRAAGQPRQPNEPAELPRIGAVVAGLRGMTVDELAAATGLNAQEALGRWI